MSAATQLPLSTLLSMSWEEVAVAAESRKWGEYAEWCQVRWLAAVVATTATGKKVTPEQLLPLDFDGVGRKEAEFEPDEARIEMVKKLWRIGHGKR